MAGGVAVTAVLTRAPGWPPGDATTAMPPGASPRSPPMAITAPLRALPAAAAMWHVTSAYRRFTAALATLHPCSVACGRTASSAVLAAAAAAVAAAVAASTTTAAAVVAAAAASRERGVLEGIVGRPSGVMGSGTYRGLMVGPRGRDSHGPVIAGVATPMVMGQWQVPAASAAGVTPSLPEILHRAPLCWWPLPHGTGCRCRCRCAPPLRFPVLALPPTPLLLRCCRARRRCWRRRVPRPQVLSGGGGRPHQWGGVGLRWRPVRMAFSGRM